MNLLRIAILTAAMAAASVLPGGPTLLLQAEPTAAAAGSTNAPVVTDLPDLIRTLQTHLGLNTSDFEARASRALTDHFGVRRLDDDKAPATDPATGAVARREHLEGGVLYLRVGRVEAGLPEALRSALTEASWITNAAGLVLDLRFADGASLEAAARGVALFSDRIEAVLRPATREATPATTPATAVAPVPSRVWHLPMAVLVNGRTGGVAEAMAAALRMETGSALVGQPTAGTHGMFGEATLADGTRLRIPSGRLLLGDGSILEAGPIAPDIRVPVTEAAERAFLGNPTAPAQTPGTPGVAGGSRSPRRRVSEADLVRAQRNEPTAPAGQTGGQTGGESPGSPPGGTETPPTRAVRLADPVLARAADLVRGLAAFRGERP
jgi:hypothetical protein